MGGHMGPPLRRIWSVHPVGADLRVRPKRGRPTPPHPSRPSAVPPSPQGEGPARPGGRALRGNWGDLSPSLAALDSVPTPFVPSGQFPIPSVAARHLPLIRGVGPLTGGIGRGGPWGKRRRGGGGDPGPGNLSRKIHGLLGRSMVQYQVEKEEASAPAGAAARARPGRRNSEE